MTRFGVLVKMAVRINAVLKSSHNHLKITTKLQNNHHSKLSRIELNGRPTTMELKKLHPSRLLGDMETWNGVIPNLHVVDKNLGGEVPAPQQAPQPRVPVQGR